MTGDVQPHIIGIDLGGTRIKALAVTAEGAELSRALAPSDGADWVEQARALARSFAPRFGPPLAIGVAAPGLAASDGRSIAIMPGRLPGLEGLDWTRFLGFEREVPVLNDAQAALLGEVWHGAAQGARNALLVTLGTGVGGAILCDGRLLRGHIGRAGHIGHITVNASGGPGLVNTPGSLEDAVGNHSLPARSAGRYSDTAALVADVARGDTGAVAIWQTMIRDLSAGLVSLINVVDPAVIILGGGIARAGELLLQPLRDAMDSCEWRPDGHRVDVVLARLGDFSGAYGAARQAWLHHFPSS